MNRLLAVDKPPTCAGEWLMPTSSEMQSLLRESDFLAGEASNDTTAEPQGECPDCGWRDGIHAWLCPTRPPYVPGADDPTPEPSPEKFHVRTNGEDVAVQHRCLSRPHAWFLVNEARWLNDSEVADWEVLA